MLNLTLCTLLLLILLLLTRPGNHTCALARYARRVMAVEINPGLCAAANENLGRNGISNAEVLVGDSHAFAKQVLKWGSYELRRKSCEVVTYTFGAVLVDPPRCGLDSNTSRLVRRYDHIIYISCNPVALMRDLAIICAPDTSDTPVDGTAADNIAGGTAAGTAETADTPRADEGARHVIERFAIFDHFAYTNHLECGVYLRRVR